jgi:hypothetical protein
MQTSKQTSTDLHMVLLAQRLIIDNLLHLRTCLCCDGMLKKLIMHIAQYARTKRHEMETAIGSLIHVQWFTQASNSYKLETPVPIL